MTQTAPADHDQSHGFKDLDPFDGMAYSMIDRLMLLFVSSFGGASYARYAAAEAMAAYHPESRMDYANIGRVLAFSLLATSMASKAAADGTPLDVQMKVAAKVVALSRAADSTERMMQARREQAWLDGSIKRPDSLLARPPSQPADYPPLPASDPASAAYAAKQAARAQRAASRPAAAPPKQPVAPTEAAAPAPEAPIPAPKPAQDKPTLDMDTLRAAVRRALSEGRADPQPAEPEMPQPDPAPAPLAVALAGTAAPPSLRARLLGGTAALRG